MVEPRPLDLLFVESAWHGNGDAWQYHLAGPSAPRPALVELLAWCREQGVPTVFWNKEDPAHYDDFLATARLFDHVLTTDEGRLPAYRRDLGHERVGLLPFAAQPAVHNPVRLPPDQHQSRDLLFGGMYFAHKFPERRAQMDLLLGAAERVSARMDTGLEIFSRYLGGDERYQFPAPLDARVVGSLDYARMLTATRAYKVVLNVNSVVDSPSMCARRVLEASACGTPVVSTPSAAIDRVFAGDEVLRVGTPEEASGRCAPSSAARRCATGRSTWPSGASGRPTPTVTASTTCSPRPGWPPGAAPAPGQRPRVDQPPAAARPRPAHPRRAGRRRPPGRAPRARLGTCPPTWPSGPPRTASRTRHPHRASELTLGECLNRLVTAADGDVVAKVDDDDLYGPHYLSDHCTRSTTPGRRSSASSPPHVPRGPGRDDLRFPDREHRYTDLVMGPTIVTGARRRPRPPVRRAVGRGEDTGFLRDVVAAGGRVYSADRFSFSRCGILRGTHMGGRFDRAARRGPCRGIRAHAEPCRLLIGEPSVSPLRRSPSSVSDTSVCRPPRSSPPTASGSSGSTSATGTSTRSTGARVPFVEPDLATTSRAPSARARCVAQKDTPAASIYVVAVPTPFKDDHAADLSYIDAATDAIIPQLRGGELLILESTSPPGTTEHMAERVLAARPDLSLDGSDDRPVVQFAPLPGAGPPGA